MNVRRLILLGLLGFSLAGCNSIPMTYAQWKKETEDRLAFERAGLQYKSPAELRAEAAEMKRIVDSTTFDKK